LLFAADRAEHVATVIAPALALGHVVVTDRYVDSSVAYQGAGRDLAPAEVARLSRWATEGLVPDLTVLLDLPAADGLLRVTAPDRLEAEPLAFHERVRERFLDLARRGGPRYLVVDATGHPDEVAAAIRARLEPVLPLSAAQREEREAARRAAEERSRVEAELRRLEEARQRAAAQEQARREAAEAEARHREEETLLEERRRLAAAEAEVRAREEAERRAVAQAEHDREEAERAARRAAEAEARRDRREAHRAEREQTRTSRHAAGHRHGGHGDPDDQLTGRRRADDPTRELSLTDELFGADDDDRTVQLPRVIDRGDER